MIIKLNAKFIVDIILIFWLRALFVALLILPLTGCRKSDDDVVESWKDLGIYLPNDEDVAYLSSHLPHSLQALMRGLSHENAHVRMCSADVVERLGESAKSLGPALRAAYIAEQKVINRVYFAKALAAIGDTSSKNIDFLNRYFAIEEDIEVRTYLAGALLIVSGVDTNPEAWEWIVSSLSPGASTADPYTDEFYEYWERRWAASYMLGKLGPRASQAVPLLDHLMRHKATPDWVKSQVKSDIAAILGRKENSNTQMK
jgi:hypothetical protein